MVLYKSFYYYYYYFEADVFMDRMPFQWHNYSKMQKFITFQNMPCHLCTRNLSLLDRNGFGDMWRIFDINLQLTDN